MSTVYSVRTFSDLYTAIMEELGVQSTDTTSKNKVKRILNMFYLEEVVPFSNWSWLRGAINVSAEPYISTDSVAVVAGSTALTFETAPAISRKGHYFAVDGYDEVYRIAQHTANSTAAVLEVPYNGTTDSDASYKVWTDRIPLPTEVRETFEVTHNFLSEPLEAVGLQKFREIVAAGPRVEGRPSFYCTNEAKDPAPYSTITSLPAISTRASSGLVKTIVFASDVSSYLSAGDQIEISGSTSYSYNGEFEVSSVSTTTITYTAKVALSESAVADLNMVVKLQNQELANETYRELMIYPSINNVRTTLHVDYMKHVVPLEEDSDEPVIPREDRIVLYYGALSLLWASIGRNPEEATRNRGLYEQKLARMTGKLEDSRDYPVIRPSRTYLSSKRNLSRERSSRFTTGSSGGSGSGSTTQAITGSANTIAIFDTNGELASDPDVSLQEFRRLDGVSSSLLGQSDTGTLTNKTIDADSNTITNIKNADIKAAAAIAYSKLNLTGNILNADINASAAIAYSKLNLATSILNADINASAAIAYSKLNLTGSILNADVNASAAIAYSKLNLATSIVNADIAAAAAIARTKLGYESVVSKTANYTLTSSDDTVTGDSSGGTFTLTLPTAVGISGKIFRLKKTDTSLTAISIATTSAQTIDGVTTSSLNTLNECLIVQSNGSNYVVLERRIPAVWTSFTPSTSQGFGTISNNELMYLRVGQCMSIQGKFTAGTVAASEARIGLPTGITSASTTYIPSIRLCGHTATTQANQVESILIEPSVTYVTFGRELWSGAGTAPITKANTNDFIASSDTVMLWAMNIPISGWNA
jgi:hypothetical protein